MMKNSTISLFCCVKKRHQILVNLIDFVLTSLFLFCFVNCLFLSLQLLLLLSALFACTMKQKLYTYKYTNKKYVLSLDFGLFVVFFNIHI